MGNKQARNEAAVVSTTSGSVLTAVGGVLIIVICPYAAPVGAALLSGGIAGAVNSASQCKRVFKDK